MLQPNFARRRPPSAGDEIDAWCTRCRIDLGHRIVAMVGSAPKRVKCMTCNSEHNFRAPKSDAPEKKTPRAPAQKKVSTSKAVSSSRQSWQAKVESGAPFVHYTISGTFREGQLIRHKKFGDGYVVSTLGSRVTVAFIDGEKTLVQGAPQ